MISDVPHRLIYIVDNEELIVRALNRVLVRAGYRTAGARDLREVAGWAGGS